MEYMRPRAPALPGATREHAAEDREAEVGRVGDAWGVPDGARVSRGIIRGCLVCKVLVLRSDGSTCVGGWRFRCGVCGRTCTDRSGTPFARYHWPREVAARRSGRHPRTEDWARYPRAGRASSPL